MKTFDRIRTLKEIKAICRRRGWSIDTRLYDRRGHDRVSIAWRHHGTAGTALVSMFNGEFFGQLKSGKWFSSSETKHEEKGWFKALLNTVYA